MFTFVGHQRSDVADADHQNSHYYDMGNTLLDSKRFALRFLSCLRSVGSGSDKAILRFTYGGASSADIAPEQEQQRPVPVLGLVEIVGGLTEFLRETVPGIEISTWYKRIEEAEKDLRVRRATLQTGKRCIDIGVMAETSARAFLDQLL
jgi:hypothetical protein